MRSLALIVAIGWIVFLLFWIYSAYGSKKNQSPTRLKEFVNIRFRVFLLLVIMLIAIGITPSSFRDYPLGRDLALKIAGTVVFLAGISLAFWARTTLGKNWGFPMTEKEEPELVTRGPYKFIRHPIYAGMLAMSLGSAFVVNVYWLAVFIAFGIYFTYSAFVEEDIMTKQFPNKYPAYKKKTKMLIPYIF